MSVQAISWVLDSSKAQYASRLVLLSIANHCDKFGQNAFPKLETLAEESLVSLREVSYSISELVKLGELKVEKGQGKLGKNLYSLPMMLPANFAGGKDLHLQSGAESTCKVVQRNKEEPSLEPSFSLVPSSPEGGHGKSKKTEKTTDPRHELFKKTLCNFYSHVNKTELYWTAADAGQLGRFIRRWPNLNGYEFREWIQNYWESEDVNLRKTPAEVLPKLHNYANGPLDRFGKPREEKRAAL